MTTAVHSTDKALPLCHDAFRQEMQYSYMEMKIYCIWIIWMYSNKVSNILKT